MKRLVLILHFLFVTLYSFAQFSLPVKTYSTRDYNGFSQNWQVEQDSSGMLYFANGGGQQILQFDGSTWSRIPLNNDYTVISLAIHEGRFFVGCIGDFGELAKNDSTGKWQFNSFIPLTGLKNDQMEIGQVWQTISLNGKIFFRSKQHVYIYDGKEVEVVNPKIGFHRPAVIDGNFWVVALEEAVLKYSDGRWESLVGTEELVRMIPTSFIPYDEHSVLITTRKQGVIRYFFKGKNYGESEPFKVSFEEFIPDVYGGLRLRNGNILLYSQTNGAIIMSPTGEILHQITRQDGLNDNKVWHVFEDAQGMLWFALNNGISMVNPYAGLLVSREGRFFEGAVYSMAYQDNDLFVGTSQGLYNLDIHPEKPFDESEFKKIPGLNVQVWNLSATEDHLAIASGFGGTYVLTGGQLKKIHNSHSYVVATPPDSPDHLFIGGRDGVYLVEKTAGRWKETWTSTDLPGEVLFAHFRKYNGNVNACWVIFRDKGAGVILFSPSMTPLRILTFDKNHGITQNEQRLVEIEGKLYVSVADGLYDTDELLGLKEGEQAERKELTNLPGPLFFYEKTNKSTFVVSNSRIASCSTSGNRFECDTLPYSWATLGDISSTASDSAGRVWFGGKDGLAVTNPYAGTYETRQFQTLFREIKTTGDSVLYDGFDLPRDLELKYKNNTLTFRFTSNWFFRGEETRYSYQLNGYDEGWHPWTSEKRAVYTNLPEGEYEFQVKSRNIYNQESNIASFSFSINPPWYRTWLAYGAYAILAFLAFLAVARIYASRQEKERKKLELLVNERTEQINLQKHAIESKNKDLEKKNLLIEQKSKDILDSIIYAKRIQDAVLPHQEKLKANFPDSFILFKPRDIVSGDFYWFTSISDHYIWAIADCTGHGVPGAFMSMIGMNLLTQVVADEKTTSPGLALEKLDVQLNKALNNTTEDETHDGMDIALCSYHKATRKLSFAGAYRPLLLIRDGEVTEIRGNRYAIGGMERVEKHFNTHELEVLPGDTVYLFTDGYGDQFGGERGKKFKYKKLVSLLVEIHRESMPEQADILWNRIESWRGDLEQIDDICIAGIRFS